MNDNWKPAAIIEAYDDLSEQERIMLSGIDKQNRRIETAGKYTRIEFRDAEDSLLLTILRSTDDKWKTVSV